MTKTMTLLTAVLAFICLGASHRTQHFIVEAPTAETAKRTGEWAEYYREQHALDWFGEEVHDWDQPCVIEVKHAKVSGGFTKYRYKKGRISDLRIDCCGAFEEVIYAVLPHEMMHAVMHTRYGENMPRWLDEGMAVSMESTDRQTQMLTDFGKLVKERKHLSLHSLMKIYHYPKNAEPVYVQGHSLTQFLLERGGKRKLSDFIKYSQVHGWERGFDEFYGFEDIDHLQDVWWKWVWEDPPTSGRIISVHSQK